MSTPEERRQRIAQADRVLENGRAQAEVERERDAALAEVAKLKERSEGLQQAGADLTLRLLGLEKERDEALASSRAWCEKAAELQAERDSLMKQRTALTRDLSWWRSHALDMGAERDRAVEDLANAITSKAVMGDRLTRERDAALAELQAEKDGALRLRQRFGARSQETFPAFVERLALHRDCAVARVKELEAALLTARSDLISRDRVPLVDAITRIDGVLYPPYLALLDTSGEPTPRVSPRERPRPC